MHRTPARIAVDAVRTNVALLTYDVGLLPDTAPLSELMDAVQGLQRALSRLEVLTLMHPELTIGDALPPGAMPADEVEELHARADELDRLVTYQPAATTVRLVASVPAHLPTHVRAVAAALTGATVSLTPTDERSLDGTFVADIGPMLAPAVMEATTADELDGTWWGDDGDEDDDVVGDAEGDDVVGDEDGDALSALQAAMRRRLRAGDTY